MNTARVMEIKADICLLGVAFIWGTTFVVVKDALSDIDPFYFLALRFGLAAVFLALATWRHLLVLDRRTVGAGIIIGAFLFSGYAFQTVGLLYTGPATAAFITGMSVILVPIFSALIYRHLPGISLVGGVACAAIGLAFLNMKEGAFTFGPGELLVAGSAACFAFHILVVARYVRIADPVLLTVVQVTAVALFSLGCALPVETLPHPIPPMVWGAIVLTGLLATSLAFLTQNYVQRFTSPTHTAIIFTMEPVFAALTSQFMGRELLTWTQGVGGLLIIAGMLVSELKNLSEREELD